jgi:hypothetical protein
MVFVAIFTCKIDTCWPRYLIFSMCCSLTCVGILCDIQVNQAANGVDPNRGTLVDLLEFIEHRLKLVEIYTRTPPTPAFDERMFNIILELLSTLALATKELKEGRSSGSVLADMLPLLSVMQLNS